MQLIERFSNARIQPRRIQHVLAVIIQKVLETARPVFFARIRQRALHQHRRAIADVAGDILRGQRLQSHPRARCVYRIGQILLRIDQRAVQIEY